MSIPVVDMLSQLLLVQTPPDKLTPNVLDNLPATILGLVYVNFHERYELHCHDYFSQWWDLNGVDVHFLFMSKIKKKLTYHRLQEYQSNYYKSLE